MGKMDGDVIIRLRAMIPEFTCVAGCSECCGMVMWTKWEWNRIPEASRKVAAPGATECPYITPEGCAVYPERPIMCRLYGVVSHDKMLCSRGGTPEKLLGPDKALEIGKELGLIFRSDKDEQKKNHCPVCQTGWKDCLCGFADSVGCR